MQFIASFLKNKRTFLENINESKRNTQGKTTTTAHTNATKVGKINGSEIALSNERTFLSWVRSSLFLGFASLLVASFGGTKHGRSKSMAMVVVLSTSATAIAVWAIGRYIQRVVFIRQFRPHQSTLALEDRVGPYIIFSLFTFAMTANLFIELT